MNPRAKIQTGSTLGGRFQIQSEIGEGGFGKIYLARQLNVDRDVALKVLPQEFVTMENVVERFRREARLASKLRHPNTITIYDYGQENGHFFIAMEYLQGEDLGDRIIREKILPLAKAIDIGRQTLESLKEAHQLGIIHRDLKPENIFLTLMGDRKDFVKVLDFGIATMATHEVTDTSRARRRQLTLQGSTIGTPTYMSPEQAAGEAVGPASDLYALGLILYEMLNGRPPFVDDHAVRIMRAHIFDSVPAFSNQELRNTRFESLVRKALEKKPQHRFQNAQEFIDALSAKNLTEKTVGFIQLRSPQPGSSIASPSSPDDEVPFQSLPSFPLPDDVAPPPGFARAPTNTISSIITVLEEPSLDDVIVLRDPKETSKSMIKDPSSSALLSSNKREEWSWNRDLSSPDASGSQILTDFEVPASRRPVLLLAIAIAIVIALTFVLYIRIATATF